jgi:hypothetical protein
MTDAQGRIPIVRRRRLPARPFPNEVYRAGGHRQT